METKEELHKQLKRLEQENAELKKYEYYYLDKFIDFKKALEEIRGICKKVALSNGCDNCDGIGFYDGCLDDDCGNYACFKILDKINEVLND